MFRHNVGGLDRTVRLLLGPLLLAVGLFALGGAQGRFAGVLVALVGLGSLASAVTGYCPLYLPFRISTAKPEASCRCAGSRAGRE